MGQHIIGRSVVWLVWLLSGWLADDVDAAEDVAVPQSWQGVLEAGGVKLRLRFDISRAAEGRLRCDLISVDQGNARAQMDSCQIKYPTIRMIQTTKQSQRISVDQYMMAW